MNGDFVCPMCGGVVSGDVSECPGCGEAFSPVENGEEMPEPEYSEETVVEETEEVLVQDELADEEPGICEACDVPLDDNGKCPTCQPPERASKSSDGCPICASKNFSKESGDLVSCLDCGNVYVRKEFEPTPQSWKWKFWVGLIFILVGNMGIALGSYIHNVLQWSPLGSMYLGYGWMDQMAGAIGIVIFVLGLILFAWSFKRERELECPSCKVVIRESEYNVYEPPEVEEEVPKEVAVKSALDEIGESAECPSCGASVSIFDDSCPGCGAVFEMEMDFEDGMAAEQVAEPEKQEPEMPERLLSASEIDENEMIMDSLELEDPDRHIVSTLNDLDDLESSFDVPLEDDGLSITCPTCGAKVGKGLDTCPGCGEQLTDGE